MDNIKEDKSTEEKILEAAQKVFVKKGMSGARMQDIANEAGINKAMLHYYFRSKEKLFEVVFTEAINRLVPRVTAILESDSPLFSKIEDFCKEYITTVIANPYIPLFVIDEMNKQSDEFLNKIWRDQKSRVSKFFLQVDEEVKNGTIKPIHPYQLLTNIISMTIFPFVAKPILHYMTDMDDQQYREFIESRKVEIPRFIIDAIKR